ncbi:MAG: hypothetical protein IJS45_05410 [Clostridia bacterium]|nr:hypothetical protein [Clostridia bacterium]
MKIYKVKKIKKVGKDHPFLISGIKMLSDALVIKIMGAAALLISSLLMLLVAADVEARKDVVTAMFYSVSLSLIFIASKVASIIADLFFIIGAERASAEDPKIKNAIIFSVIGMVSDAAFIVQHFLFNSSWVTMILSSVASCCAAFIVEIIFIKGTVRAVKGIDDEKTEMRGSRLLIMIAVSFAVKLIAHLFCVIDYFAIVYVLPIVLVVAASAISVIEYVLIILFIKGSKKKLAANDEDLIE